MVRLWRYFIFFCKISSIDSSNGSSEWKNNEVRFTSNDYVNFRSFWIMWLSLMLESYLLRSFGSYIFSKNFLVERLKDFANQSQSPKLQFNLFPSRGTIKFILRLFFLTSETCHNNVNKLPNACARNFRKSLFWNKEINFTSLLAAEHCSVRGQK